MAVSWYRRKRVAVGLSVVVAVALGQLIRVEIVKRVDLTVVFGFALTERESEFVIESEFQCIGFRVSKCLTQPKFVRVEIGFGFGIKIGFALTERVRLAQRKSFALAKRVA